MIKNGNFSNEELAEIDMRCEKEVFEANKFAVKSKFPDINELSKYVFKE
jgi:TPP-dependent pyruvate/acetoin dehydrogenase alpha subunit